MIIESVKTILGEELSAQVETALKGKGKDGKDPVSYTHLKELARIQKDTAVRMALTGRVHDPADVLGLLDLEKIQIGEDGGLKTDLEGLLKPIQEAKPYLFKPDQEPAQPSLKGAQPAPPTGGELPKDYTMEELGKLSMEEYAAYREKQTGFPRN